MQSSPRSRFLASFVAGTVGIAVGLRLGGSYIPRLSNHAGYYLVGVDDVIAAPAPAPPRHLVLVVSDGLRRDAAERLTATARLQRSGQCRVSDQGSYTVSRPVYALLSTGLEVDRAGARNNELTAPLAAESIWDVATAHGRDVRGASHLPWFRELFPRGFRAFRVRGEQRDDVFAESPLADVSLFHPTFVDEAGHAAGAASPAYAAAAQRTDDELNRLLDRVDLNRDTVIFTSDHGHRDEGGHGGSQKEIREVLACFAGPSIVRREDRLSFDGRNTAPLMSVLLGLPFPRHMRAGDDALDELWTVVREDPANAAYAHDRRAAVARFRAENERALRGFLGAGEGSWPRLYAREARWQWARLGLFATLALAAAAAGLKRLHGRERWLSASWIAAVAALGWSIHHAVLGDFDYTVVNRRDVFLGRAFLAAGATFLAATALHGAVVRDAERMLRDHASVLGLLLLAAIAHPAVYGWPIGFPLPPAPARYFPFFGAVALVVQGIGVVLVGLGAWLRARARA